jgi:hypothetical protein
MPNEIGLGILSWKDPWSLRNALESYWKADFFDQFDEVLICFQEVSEEDKALAAEFGVPYKGTDSNKGIFGGFKTLAEAMNSEYLMLVENDCPLIESGAEAARQISLALDDLKSGKAQQYRFRHRWQPGQRFQLATKFRRYFHPLHDGAEGAGVTPGMERFFRPLKKRRLRGGALYVERHPEQRFPEVISKTEGGHFLVDSSVLNWTNQSIMVRRQFYLETILARVETHPSSKPLHGYQDIERALRSRWWRRQHFKIGVADPGLFTHKRLGRDGEERP